MAELKTYNVHRRLDGDRMYEDGDTRQLTAADAAHLVATGAISLADNQEAKGEVIVETKTVDPVKVVGSDSRVEGVRAPNQPARAKPTPRSDPQNS